MIGLLLWYFCLKKQGRTELKLAMSVRKKNSNVKTPQAEDQLLERTVRRELTKDKFVLFTVAIPEE